ncbi:hypothetical protein BKA66DRAFT_443057 [Pyrenochaeta sp. MPI-SDFR-AT-0127]|nr:hypothetical protein BKA66DRAFT_443057 [Pyrenochaeta sp. MPI-SDFR-AT-0127]
MPPKRALERKRQSKLNFSPATKSSSVAKPSSSTGIEQSPSRHMMGTRTRAAQKLPTKASKNAQIYSSSEDELQAEAVPSGTLRRLVVDASSQSEEDEEEQRNTQSAARKRRHAKDNSNSDEYEATVTVKPRKRQRQSKAKVESDEEEDEEQLRLPRKRRKIQRLSTPEQDAEEHPQPRSARRRATRAQTTSEESEEESTPPRSTRRRATRRPSTPEGEDISSPRDTKRRAARGDSALSEEDLDDADKSRGDRDDGKENDDLKEDLAFLRSSPLPDRGRLRSTQDKPKNERQKALEALKRRRAGTNEPSSSATPIRRRTVVLESDSESELEIIKEEPESDLEIRDPDDIEDDEEDEDSDRDANALDMFQEDNEDAGFIDDDADAIIGEPSATADLDELRLLTNLSRAKSKDLFKHAVEWMVMKKIHPAFNSTQSIYTLTFRKLDDEVKGLAGSKFTSSVWTPDFTRSIRARPDLMIDEIPSAMRAVMGPHCEACNRTNHTATFELMLTGQPYDAETLEPLEADSDSDSNSDSSSDSELSADSEALLNGEKPAYDAQGERLPPESHRFMLGSTCKANAQVAHTLHHWRYHLYQWVKDYLEREGHLSAKKLVKRDKWSDKKRHKAALKIVDGMDSEGEVRKLYRLYKDQVEFAVEARNEYKDGWGRRN